MLKDSTQVLSVGSVLIVTVTFGATFALPGGYRADDHTDGGSPTLDGRYAFLAFVIANTVAFICSSIATVGFMYSGSPMVHLESRTKYIVASNISCRLDHIFGRCLRAGHVHGAISSRSCDSHYDMRRWPSSSCIQHGRILV